jgi:hypothetical protein
MTGERRISSCCGHDEALLSSAWITEEKQFREPQALLDLVAPTREDCRTGKANVAGSSPSAPTNTIGPLLASGLLESGWRGVSSSSFDSGSRFRFLGLLVAEGL